MRGINIYSVLNGVEDWSDFQLSFRKSLLSFTTIRHRPLKLNVNPQSDRIKFTMRNFLLLSSSHYMTKFYRVKNAAETFHIGYWSHCRNITITQQQQHQTWWKKIFPTSYWHLLTQHNGRTVGIRMGITKWKWMLRLWKDFKALFLKTMKL